MKIKVLYFAQLKQLRGLSEEICETEAATVASLYSELMEKHPLNLQLGQVRTARNDRFCPHDTKLEDGDTVAFMPPMSGG